MSLASKADTLRGQVIYMAHELLAPGTLDKEAELALCRLVFEIDRLADRCEQLGGAKTAKVKVSK